jgi:hypothetical protein
MMLRAVVWHIQHRLEEARSEALRAADIFEKLGSSHPVKSRASGSEPGLTLANGTKVGRAGASPVYHWRVGVKHGKTTWGRSRPSDSDA